MMAIEKKRRKAGSAQRNYTKKLSKMKKRSEFDGEKEI